MFKRMPFVAPTFATLLAIGAASATCRTADAQAIRTWGALAWVNADQLDDVVEIASGGPHIMARYSDGRVAAWGSNFFRQCEVPGGLSSAISIAAGREHSVAARLDGSVVCWGDNSLGQSTVPTGLGAVATVAAGRHHTVARLLNGTVRCWGAGAAGLVGDPHYGQSVVPTGLGGVVAVSAGGFHSIALTSAGGVACWGRNGNGQCTVPAGLGAVSAVSGGAYFTMALRSTGTVACWGQNTEGQCNVPPGLASVVKISAGAFHSAALRSDGTVTCWGWNNSGQCTVPASLTGVTALACGEFQVTALRSDGTVRSWGSNSHGQSNAPTALPAPVQLATGAGHFLSLDASGSITAWGGNTAGEGTVPAGLPVASEVAAGLVHSMARSAEGQVNCWGDNTYGQSSVPANLGVVDSIGAGWYHSLAVRSDGGVVCWGWNAAGQCAVPTGLGAAVAATGGYQFSMAIRQDRTVAGWGSNSVGQLNVPAGLGNVETISCGDYHTAALRADGSVACWGGATAGQSQVPANLGPVVAVAAGHYHTVALKADGSVRGWGWNDGSASAPFAVPTGLAPVQLIAAGGSTIALIDGCPNDPNKTSPGICGCGVSDADTDGDGTVDCNDACPENAALVNPVTYFADSDADGFGSATSALAVCETTPPAGYATNSTDCDDASALVYPGAEERCADLAIDNDCDGVVDEDEALDRTIFYADADNDGAGDPSSTVLACTAPAGFVAVAGDGCPANGALVAPVTYFADADGDGFGSAAATSSVCETSPPAGFTTDSTDCDDASALVYPGAEERCADLAIDNDCDGVVDEDEALDRTIFYADADNDGAGDPSSTVLACTAPAGFVAVAGDGCPANGALVAPVTYFADADGDGFGSAAATSSVCETSPPAGFTTDSTDCDDASALVYPGAEERCADLAIDNDCDGVVDEDEALDRTIFYADADNDGAGDPSSTVLACTAPAGFVAVAGDGCPEDGDKLAPGDCGCGVPDADANGNGASDCLENCDGSFDLFAVTPQAGARVGAATALSGDWIALGAPDEDVDGAADAGAVYVYRRSADRWAAYQRLTAPQPSTDARFGAAVAWRAEGLVVGAPGDAGGDGQVFDFSRLENGSFEPAVALESNGPTVETVEFATDTVLGFDALTPRSFKLFNLPTAAADVRLYIEHTADMGAANETYTVSILNYTSPALRSGTDCSESTDMTLIPADVFNASALTGRFVFLVSPNANVDPCVNSSVRIRLSYETPRVQARSSVIAPFDNANPAVATFTGLRATLGEVAIQVIRRGDINASNETYQIYLDGVAIGTAVLNPEIGGPECVTITDTRFATAAQFAAAAADGSVTVSAVSLGGIDPCEFSGAQIELRYQARHERGLGAAVASDGTAIFAGAPDSRSGSAEGAGSVVKFTREQGTDYAPTVRVSAASPVSGARFGTSIAIADGVVAVGAPGPGGVDGTVHLFSSTTGNSIQSIAAPAGAAGFGSSLALTSSALAVGAPAESEAGFRRAGAVYGYVRSGAGSWVFAQRVSDPSAATDRGFGTAVALVDGALAIGTPAGAGAIYVASALGSGAYSTPVLRDSCTEEFDGSLGASVASDARTFLVGAPDAGLAEGRARMYTLAPPCSGDIFTDGRVDGADLAVLLTRWGPADSSGIGDIDGDGMVAGADLAILLSSWGVCP
jgi:alpha-tubulin suppressor-like RCC1 family protein